MDPKANHMPKQLILFTTRTCAQCPPVKVAAREAAAYHGIQLTERDAQDFRALAALYSVQQVPALVLLSVDMPPRVTTRAKTADEIRRWIGES